MSTDSPRVRVSYRLPPETLAQIDQIAEHKEGLAATQVLINAVKKYHESTFGKPEEPKEPKRKSKKSSDGS